MLYLQEIHQSRNAALAPEVKVFAIIFFPIGLGVVSSGHSEDNFFLCRSGVCSCPGIEVNQEVVVHIATHIGKSTFAAVHATLCVIGNA